MELNDSEIKDKNYCDSLKLQIEKLTLEVELLSKQNNSLLQENEFVKQIIQYIPMPFSIKIDKGRIIYANQKYCEITNNNSNYDINNIFTYNENDKLENNNYLIDDNVISKSLITSKSIFIAKNFDKILLEIISDANKSLNKIDIPENNAVNFKSIVENSFDMIILFNDKGYIKYYSPAITNILGYEKEELETKNFNDFVFPIDKKRFLKKLKQLQEEKIAYDTIELKVLHKEGIWRIFEVKLTNKLQDKNINAVLANFRDVTERRISEEFLKLDCLRSKTMLQSMPDVIMVISKKGIVLEFYSGDDDDLQILNPKLIGKNIREIFSSKQSITLLNSKIKEAIKTEDVEVFEYEISNSDLKHFYEARMVSLGNDELLIISRNITDRKKIELIIRENEEKYRQLIEFCPLAIMTLKDKKINFINKYGLKLLGASQSDEIIGRNFVEFVYSDQINNKQRKIQNINFNINQVSLSNEKLYKIDGSIINVEITSMILNYQNESSILVVMKDLDEYKNYKQELLLFKTICDKSSQAIVISDLDLNLMYFNQAYSEILGLSIEQAKQKKIIELVTNESREVYNGIILPSIFEGKNWMGELEIKNSKGEIIPIILFINVAFDDDNMLRYIYAYIFDNSLVRKHETALINNTKILFELNQKLADSEQQFKELNASKDKFFSIIAHNLKAPLTGFLYLTNLLSHFSNNINIEEIINIGQLLNNSALELNKLLDSLLQWSRVQTGNLNIILRAFDLKEIINEVLTLYNSDFIKKNINIVDNTNDTMLIYADYSMIKKVIEILISNAIKFSFNDSQIVFNFELDDNYLKFSIKDFGVGISESNIDKLFKIDEHIITEGTNQEKGTGLGLIIAGEFLEKNNGQIFVESELGKGTKFTILLPKAILENE